MNRVNIGITKKGIEWRPVKVSISGNTSDVNYLVTRGKSDGVVYYDTERDALRVCKEKNLSIIKDLLKNNYGKVCLSQYRN